MLARMSQGPINAMAVAAGSAVVTGVTVATLVIDPFNRDD